MDFDGFVSPQGVPDTWRLIKAHGTAVGLPSEDDMGNSEVGHNALGAGRIYAQGAKLVDLALASGKIYEDEGFKYISESFEKGTVHLVGLLSDGGVHSRLDQVQVPNSAFTALCMLKSWRLLNFFSFDFVFCAAAVKGFSRTWR